MAWGWAPQGDLGGGPPLRQRIAYHGGMVVMGFWDWVIVGIAAVGGLVLATPWLMRKLSPVLGPRLAARYMASMRKRFTKAYPQLAARVEGFGFGPQLQPNFEATVRRLPPHEMQKLQLEFMRLKDNLLKRHPELAGIAEAGQNAEAQAKAFEGLLKLPDGKRAALEKDLLWAWDQMKGSYPRLVGPIEACFKATPSEAKAPEAAATK